MQEVLAGRFIELLKPLFPSEAEIRRRPSSGDLLFLVDWKLNNDQSRANKRSRKIVIHVTRETLEDYSDGTDQHRRSEERRITTEVATRLRSFQPNHETPHGTPEPEEVWSL